MWWQKGCSSVPSFTTTLQTFRVNNLCKTRQLLSGTRALISTRQTTLSVYPSRSWIHSNINNVKFLIPVIYNKTLTADKSSKGGGGNETSKKTKKAVEKIIDDLVEDEEEETFVDIQNSQLNKFLMAKGGASGGGKGKKGGALIKKLPYAEFTELVKGERLWKEMDKSVENLKTFYIQQLTVRSVSSLDELPVELDGDTYPLNELTAISKKDPKRLIIDSSAFPEATKTIMEAIRSSGMNLNPQQEGLTIYVPIPKVTKEHRQNLAEGAKKKLNECKNNIKKIQNNHVKKVSEDELSDEITKEDSKAAQDTVKLISDHFQSQADALCATKIKDLLG